MVERAANYKKFVGNVCLDRNLAPGRCFLRRNLRDILDSHELLLNQSTNTTPHEEMTANEKRGNGWDYPTREMLEDLMNGDRPVLRVEWLRIRHPGSNAKAQIRSVDASTDAEQLDWLPDPETEFTAPCVVGINVLDTRSTKRNIYFDSRTGTITQNQSEDHHPHYNIELDSPLLVELSKLLVVKEAGTNGYRSWKRTIAANYILEVTIQCRDSDDTAKLLSQIEYREISSYQSAPGNEGVLKASWDHLRQCPSESDLLPLKRAQNHRSLELPYKLEVSMGWQRRKKSTLAVYNKIFAKVNNPVRQLPTPSSSEDLEKTSDTYLVTYNFQEHLTARTKTLDGLICPFCPHGREHCSFDRLRLHCMTCHDHFKFEVDENETSRDDSVVRLTVWIGLGEKPRDRQNISDPDVREHWIAPVKPFSISASIRGENDWISSGRAKTGIRRGRPRRDRERDYVPPSAPQPIRKRPAPDEVEDLPEQRPKKRQVPDMPGVNFYHTTSKQLMEPGEYVAESDDDVDESWRLQNQSRALEELGVTGIAKEFTIAFNQHLALEQSDSSILTREALVRFTRSHHTKLQNIEWQKLFRAKLNQVRDAGIIDDDLVAYCIRGLRASMEVRTPDREQSTVDETDTTQQTNGTPHVATRSGKAQGKRKVWSAGGFILRDSEGFFKGKSTSIESNASSRSRGLADGEVEAPNGDASRPSTQESNLRASQQPSDSDKTKHAHFCTCGESAKAMRKAIACADTRCSRKDFHLACVGLDRRVYGWKCFDCSP